jgi:periplasmic divalent cation tolerance protein
MKEEARGRGKKRTHTRSAGKESARRPVRASRNATAALRQARPMTSGRVARVLLVTAPNEEAARSIARVLVDERLAACVNVIPMSASIYRWEGKIVEEPESLLLVKTSAARVEPLAQRIAALHPYSVPEILSLPVERGLAAYIAWVVEATA